MKINIGLTDNDRKGVIRLLNGVLADEFTLYTQARNCHWNVVGTDFSELHKFFEAQYEELDEIMDDVAERVRSVGGDAVATLKEYVSLTTLKEPAGYPAAPKMLEGLLENHEKMIRALRVGLDTAANKYHDMGTSDFLTGLMEQHEKMSWMVRSYLEKR